MKTDEHERHFKTADLILASTLSLYLQAPNLDRINTRKVVFIFDRSLKLNQLVEQFWQVKLLVEPQAFANQLKSLKTRIYSGE